MEEAAYRSWLSGTNLGDGGISEYLDEDGGTKNILILKEQVLRSRP
jgi:hypothetical protein